MKSDILHLAAKRQQVVPTQQHNFIVQTRRSNKQQEHRKEYFLCNLHILFVCLQPLK